VYPSFHRVLVWHSAPYTITANTGQQQLQAHLTTFIQTYSVSDICYQMM